MVAFERVDYSGGSLSRRSSTGVCLLPPLSRDLPLELI
jgi:hypothetical protein